MFMEVSLDNTGPYFVYIPTAILAPPAVSRNTTSTFYQGPYTDWR